MIFSWGITSHLSRSGESEVLSSVTMTAKGYHTLLHKHTAWGCSARFVCDSTLEPFTCLCFPSAFPLGTFSARHFFLSNEQMLIKFPNSINKPRCISFVAYCLLCAMFFVCPAQQLLLRGPVSRSVGITVAKALSLRGTWLTRPCPVQCAFPSPSSLHRFSFSRPSLQTHPFCLLLSLFSLSLLFFLALTLRVDLDQLCCGIFNKHSEVFT